MASMKYCDKHNQVGLLKKLEESTGFETATASTLAIGTLEIRANHDLLLYNHCGILFESKLQFSKCFGISMKPNYSDLLYERVYGVSQLASPKSGGWDQFGSNLATALICLSTRGIYNFSKLIFDGIVANLKNPTHPHVAEERTMSVDNLLQLVPKLLTKVKKIEDALKRRRVVLPDSEDEDAEISSKQGRNLQEEDLDEMVRNMMKDKSEVFKTPTQSKTSGEEDMSPTTLKAAKTLSKVASSELKFNLKSTFTEEDWDAIRAKLEANAELTKNVLGKELPEEDFVKKMVELVNQRKKLFAEERAKARRSKPMTQSLLRNYMMTYLKNQGTWKLTQLKKLCFEEVKEEFDKLVKQVESFVPINIEAKKAQLKRYEEELQTKISKK
ncbi:hypothetical protein Tco_1490407 [Tanacetum coccineum]